MKRNKRKTFAYRPSDKIISRESIVSVILGAAGIIGYYLLLFGSIKTGGTSSPLSGAGGWILLVVSAIGLYFWNTKYERYRSSDEMEDHWMYLQRNCAGSICDHFCDWNNCNDLSKERKR